MSGLLYEVEPSDLQTFVVVTTAFAAVALVACCLPALEAADVDPAMALRHE
jgi:ABC-type lipoprotein release transport system permease subunit